MVDSGTHSAATPDGSALLPPKPECGPEGFAAVDLRVGRVVVVEELPEARPPAWRISVDFGPGVGVLWTSARVTNHSREELLSRMVVGAVNLGSRRIAGFTSEFLLLGAPAAGGDIRLLEVDDSVVPGTQVA